MNSIITQDAHRVRPRQDPQRSIVGSGVVEMNAKCQDLAKHTRWGVRIYHAVLYRPRSPTRSVVAIPRRQGPFQANNGRKANTRLTMRSRSVDYPLAWIVFSFEVAFFSGKNVLRLSKPLQRWSLPMVILMPYGGAPIDSADSCLKETPIYEANAVHQKRTLSGRSGHSAPSSPWCKS